MELIKYSCDKVFIIKYLCDKVVMFRSILGKSSSFSLTSFFQQEAIVSAYVCLLIFDPEQDCNEVFIYLLDRCSLQA